MRVVGSIFSLAAVPATQLIPSEKAFTNNYLYKMAEASSKTSGGENYGPEQRPTMSHQFLPFTAKLVVFC